MCVVLALAFMAGEAARADAAPRAERAAAMAQLRVDAGQPGATTAMATLLDRIGHERDPRLRKFELAALLRQRIPMTRDQRARLLGLVRNDRTGLLPKRPPIPESGPIEVRYYIDEPFLISGLQSLVQDYSYSSAGALGFEARRGRLRVLVDQADDRVLKDLKDPNVHVIIYSGHSKFGEVVERALQEPGLVENGPKLLVQLGCKGNQTAALLSAKLPRSHLITTRDYAFSQTNQDFVLSLLTSLERSESYQQIRRRAGVDRKSYFVFPDQTEQLKHTDLDGNGQLDAAQLDDPAAAFAPLSPMQRKAAQRLLSGVHYLQVANIFDAEQSHWSLLNLEQASIPLDAVGIVPGDGRSVTRISEVERDGKRRFQVGLDEKFAGAPRELIGAATVYELQRHLQSALLGRSDDKANKNALSAARKYIQFMHPGPAGKKALDRLEKHVARPDDLL